MPKVFPERSTRINTLMKSAKRHFVKAEAILEDAGLYMHVAGEAENENFLRELVLAQEGLIDLMHEIAKYDRHTDN